MTPPRVQNGTDSGCGAAGNFTSNSLTVLFLFSSTASCTNSSITPTPSLPANLQSVCCDALLPVTSHWFSCLHSGFPTFIFFFSYAFLPHSLHGHVFTEQLLCHHATWDTVKVTSGEYWTSGCCSVPTHVYLDFGAKTLCEFPLRCQSILLCLLQSVHALLGETPLHLQGFTFHFCACLRVCACYRLIYWHDTRDLWKENTFFAVLLEFMKHSYKGTTSTFKHTEKHTTIQTLYHLLFGPVSLYHDIITTQKNGNVDINLLCYLDII